ncbi:zinc finger BED domain-containing protein RICESLEEPER 2-like [Salvia hispanica]|uniref:zinc finger BED domain-containing protein RICESLEEPER 2-like n=1 Tax=Salvia hispanica TaxID=49212 RepID=UPI002008F9C1|nr:zinc finger BED domain-containing protein RICESLEEPER 2-like [Salvia hispanica]
MVQEGLEVASEALDKIRASIKYVKASEARMIEFKECARKTGIELPSSLRLDVPTHWESIYLVLDSGIKCRRAFCLLEFEDLAYKYCPTEEEWNRGELMLKFLEPFYNISTMISGSSSPTSGFFFIELWKIAHFLSKNYRSQDEEVKSMSHSMDLKFAPYWEEHSEILSIGAVFDPRIKLKLLEYCYSRIDNHSSEEKISKLKMRLYTLYDEYKKKRASASPVKVSQSSGSSSSQVRGLRINKKVLAGWKEYRGGTSEGKSFLDSYLDEPAMDVNAEIDLFE